MNGTGALLASAGVLIGVAGFLGEAVRSILLVLSLLFVVLVFVSFIATRMVGRRIQ